jgi:DNA-binding response OmpR family regulator
MTEDEQMSLRVLVVEDDDRIRAALRMGLEDEGWTVCEAEDGGPALEAMATERPDAMIVDLMLGAMDGFTCIHQVRRISDVPIIVVSARVDTHDIVAGLEAGADDYVTKPFQIKEISARLRALRRRATMPRLSEESTGEIVLDPGRDLVLSAAAGSVRLGRTELALTLTEFQLLAELADRPGVVLSRAALLERIWDHSFDGEDRLVDAHIRRLRTKVEVDPSDPRLVITVRGMGYRLDLQ